MDSNVATAVRFEVKKNKFNRYSSGYHCQTLTHVSASSSHLTIKSDIQRTNNTPGRVFLWYHPRKKNLVDMPTGAGAIVRRMYPGGIKNRLDNW